jgi:hypothetical protein
MIAPLLLVATGLALLAGGASTGSDTAPALERALRTVDADHIGADLRFIASDALEGRDTPSEGLRIAARYLRARLERLGWQPGAPDGYLWEYELQRQSIDMEHTAARLVTDGAVATLAFGEDWMFSGRNLRNQDRSGPLVFCGAGSEDELEGVDLEGKFALVVVPVEGSWYAPYRRVRELGALGVVWAPAEGQDAAFGENWEEWRTDLAGGRIGAPADSIEPGDPGAFNSCALGRRALRRIFELAGLGETLPAAGTELAVTFVDKRAVDPASPRIPVENVCGFWPGSDPVLAREAILVTAHYDHEGVRGGEIYNGADDNGSGTCALLALAEALTEHGPMKRSILLMWVSGEEKGLLGSRAWSLDPWLPDGATAVCNINVDMVGRNAPEQLLVTPTSDHPAYNGLTRLVEALSAIEGFTDLGSADRYYSRSDHAMFQENMGLPVCFLFSDVHEDYHRPTDTVEKVDTDKIRRVTRLVLRMLDGLQGESLDL